MRVRRLLPAVPALLLAAWCVAAAGEALGAWRPGLLPLGPWEAGAAAALAVVSAVGSLHLAHAARAARRQAREARRRSQDAAAAERRSDFLQEQNRRLRRQVELLAAMREVTRVVTNDVDFERILGQVLRIVQGLLETRMIRIYLADLSTGALAAQAEREDDATRFAGAIEPDPEGMQRARGAFESQTLVRYAEDEQLRLLLPLRADRECLGVLELAIDLEGEPEARAAAAEQLEEQARDLAEHIAVAIKTSHLHDKAIVDGLTKLYTKRHFLEQLDAAINMARRHRQTFSLVLVDIDHFKQVNDTYGHLTGDHVLVGVADALRKALRKSDAAFRYGGEELAMLLPETDAAGAARLAERVRSRLEKMKFKAEDGRRLKVTASFGVAEFRADMQAANALIEAADAALYRAKEGGRNRVVAAET